MEDGRTYRPRNEVFVRDWNTFKQVWGDSSFIKSLGDPKSEACKKMIHEKLNSLVTDNGVEQCFVFPDSLKPEYVELFKEEVCSPGFAHLLDYEYEGMYLDQKKQLVVFRKRASVEGYLSKYRLNKPYGNLFTKIIEIWKDALGLIIERNIKISNEESQEEIEKITLKIDKFNKEELNPVLDPWRELTNRIMLDFKSQPKKEEIQFLGINDLLTREIKALCNSHELYFADRYEKVSPYDEYRDMVVTKIDRNEGNYTVDSSLSDDDEALENQENKNSEEEDEDKELKPKVITIVEPKGLENVIFLSYEENGAKCLVELQSSGVSNPIEYIQIKLLEPLKTDYQKSFLQKIEVTNNQREFHVVLPCLHSGFSHYELRTGNSKGLCINPSHLKIWFEGNANSIDETGIMKLANSNYNLYVLGRNETGLIPNESIESFENNEMVISTDEKWQKTKFQCSDFSISTHVIISNRTGDVAGWGKMYYFDSEGEHLPPKSGEDSDEETDPLSQILSEKFRIEQPSLILREKNIRQVSCGEGYCLMVDGLGKAWSFGINTFGQLGLDHTNENIDTTEPVMIPFFRTFNIFVTQVTASVFGGSFAIDEKGQGYRWGTNQIDQSNRPIKDNYNNIINFEYPDIFAPQCIPIPISNKSISDRISSIHAGMHFVLALTENNRVYGWGSVRFYGRGKFEDAHFNEINNFCNPVNVRENIVKISVGEEHVLALTTNGDLLGWGRSIYYREEKEEKFVENAEIVAKNFKGFFTCGTDFSILEEEGKAKVLGKNKKFKNRIYELPCIPEKVLASEGTIFVMGAPLISDQQKPENNSEVSTDESKPSS